MRVAVVGTGVMGAPMARNIARAGHEVRAWNRTRAKAEPLTQDGVTVCDSVGDAVAGTEVAITMLSDGAAVEAVAGELVDALDGIWWQASTVGLAATERLAAAAERAGLPFVDAPVLGTRQPAEEGKLTVLASGPADARERCAPLFDAVGVRTLELGEAGAGTRTKLVVNAWLVALVEGLAETILLAEGLGVDPRTFLDIIDGGPMGPPYAKMKGTAMIERDYDPSFALTLARKDAGLVAEAAEAAGLDLPLVRVVEQRMQQAIDAGHGEDDMAATIEAGRE
jgi:3-hydroxyisobutyrate dehydrogenase